MKRTYIVVIGDVGNSHYHLMINNMDTLGETRKILDNTYILNTKEDISYEEVRNKISGPEIGFCIVISIEGLKAAWSLTKDDSNYLQSFFIRNHDQA